MFEYYGTHSVSLLLRLVVMLFNRPVGRYVPSSELVPGDVYEVTDPALTQFPCDSILLAGDCIVNESMLTGMKINPAYLLVQSLTVFRRICTCIQSSRNRSITATSQFSSLVHCS